MTQYYLVHGCARPHGSKTGFTVVELLVAVSIFAILGSIGFQSIVGFYEQRRLRSAALEVIGLIQEQRAQVMAKQLTSNQACLSLDPADALSPISPGKGMVSGVTDLEVKTEAGDTPVSLCFTPEGLVLTPMTLVLRSPAVASQGDWCVVVTPLLAQPRLNWRPSGQSSCRPFDNTGGTL
jgi:prepilin-type N-terminal cleavage/methylation domain-containing protein